MSMAWPELVESAGKKIFTIHEMRDGFLMTMRWNWPETGIHEEIAFFTPIEQARQMAEQIFMHIGHLRQQQPNIGAQHLNQPDSSSPDDPVPDAKPGS
jgi:hypothetical protein